MKKNKKWTCNTKSCSEVIKGRHVSSIINLEDKLFEADTEKRRLEEERDAARAEVAALEAQVRDLE
jgi:hypothetical protein